VGCMGQDGLREEIGREEGFDEGAGVCYCICRAIT